MRTARGAGGRAGGTDCTGLPVTALLARPVRGTDGPHTLTGHAPEILRSTTFQREGQDDSNRRREEWSTGARERRQSRLAAFLSRRRPRLRWPRRHRTAGPPPVAMRGKSARPPAVAPQSDLRARHVAARSRAPWLVSTRRKSGGTLLRLRVAAVGNPQRCMPISRKLQLTVNAAHSSAVGLRRVSSPWNAL